MSRVDDAAALMVAVLTAAHIKDDDAYNDLVESMTHIDMRLVLSGLVGIVLSTANTIGDTDAFLQSFGADIATGRFGARDE
jgi:hypothetical protein